MKKKQDSVKPDNYQATAMRVSRISIAVNVGLSIFKLIAGILAHSGAMISDAIHSASDVLSTVGVMVGVHLAGKKSDQEHPYGHERMESIVSILLAVFLAAVGIGIGWSGLQDILSGEYNSLPVPGILAAAAAILSIAVKDVLVHTRRCKAHQFSGSDGGCLASPFGLAFFHRCLSRHHGRTPRLPDPGPAGIRNYLPVHSEGCL